MAIKVKRPAKKAARPAPKKTPAKKPAAAKHSIAKRPAKTAPKKQSVRAKVTKPAKSKKAAPARPAKPAQPSRGKQAVAAAKAAFSKAVAVVKPQAQQSRQTIEQYQRSLEGWQKEIVIALREIVKSVDPAVQETIHAGQPVYELYGPLAFMKPLAKHVNIGFLRGSELTDPQGMLAGESGRVRHLKVGSPQSMPKDAIEKFVREAIFLNREKSAAQSPE